MSDRKWMLFVDGENFTIRGQTKATEVGPSLKEGPYFKKDGFLWMPNSRPLERPYCIRGEVTMLEYTGIRAYYYTSIVGSHEDVDTVRESLWKIGFTPKVFKKPSGDRKSKGVDIALATDMLTHAFQNHFDVAILLAGDADYGPLVARVKSLGKIVWVWFFERKEDGLGPELKLASDVLIPLDEQFTNNWK
jgi:NYN domain